LWGLCIDAVSPPFTKSFTSFTSTNRFMPSKSYRHQCWAGHGHWATLSDQKYWTLDIRVFHASLITNIVQV
ncbi:13079_t:CDS:2, partial [Ambispora leptoticha]